MKEKIYLVTKHETIHGALTVLLKDYNVQSVDYIDKDDLNRLREEGAIVIGKVPFYMYGNMVNVGVPYIHVSINKEDETKPFADCLSFTYISPFTPISTNADIYTIGKLIEGISKEISNTAHD